MTRHARTWALIHLLMFTLVSAANAIAGDAVTPATDPSPVPSNWRWEPSWRSPSDCGPMGLYVLLKLLDYDVSIDRVRQELPVDQDKGCTLASLTAASIRLGCPATGSFVSPDALSSIKSPYILHCNGSQISGVGHYLVIASHSAERKGFLVLNTDQHVCGWVPDDTIYSQFSGYILLPQTRFAGWGRVLGICVTASSLALYFFVKRFPIANFLPWKASHAG
jgi:hypothetical protein